MLFWGGAQVAGPEVGGRSVSIADGYLVGLNFYDNQIYTLGKGPSSTTVMGPDNAVPLGSSVLIKGTVTDDCAGAKRLVQEGKFNIVPAVADEYMSEWMEFLYMQQECPEEGEGVEVVITTYDPNGNTYELGRTTTSLSGTFGCEVSPPVPGLYKIIATFEGTESYYGSYAETYLVVEGATSPELQLEPELAKTTQASEALFISTELIMIIAAVIFALIALVGFYIFRK